MRRGKDIPTLLSVLATAARLQVADLGRCYANHDMAGATVAVNRGRQPGGNTVMNLRSQSQARKRRAEDPNTPSLT